MKKVALKYGLICGPFFLLIIFWTYIAGGNPFNQGMWIVNIGVYGVFMFFAGYEFKNYHFDGYFHFWQGMSIGTLVYLTSALIFGPGLYIWLLNDDALMQLYNDKAREVFEANKDLFDENKMGEDVIIRSPIGLTFQMAVQNNLLSAFFVSTIVAIILRKKPN